MSNIKLVFSILLLLIQLQSNAQTKEYKAGHIFTISLPNYLEKTYGINDNATIQFKNVIKDVYGFVIEDSKEAMVALDMKFGSANEFYEHFIAGFIKDEENRTVGLPKSTTVNNNSIVENDVTFFDKDAKSTIYYFVGIVETKTTFYKVLCYTSLQNKDKYKEDFQKILYSLKD